MAYATVQERRLLRALETLLAFTEPESLADQQTDPRIREAFRAARESAERTADEARKVLRDLG